MSIVPWLGPVCGVAITAFAACSSSPNSAGDDSGISLSGDGDFASSTDGGLGSEGAFGGSGSGASSGSSGSSGGMRGGSNGGSSGARGSSSGGGNGGDGGCPASCDRLKRCCPLLAMIDAGAALVSGCNSIAAGCNQQQCTQSVNMSIGGQMCPP